jgi:hypothetical protein
MGLQWKANFWLDEAGCFIEEGHLNLALKADRVEQMEVEGSQSRQRRQH